MLKKGIFENLKKMKKLLFLTLLFAGTFSALNAQKVAHLNYDSLISMMPEAKTASEAANNYLKGLESELMSMRSEFDAKYKDYTDKEKTMSELTKTSRQEDLQRLQDRIQDFQKKAEQDFRQKQAELSFPLLEKAKKGIAMVAKEGGYKYVLDSSLERTSILYSEPAEDILMLVKKKLDSMPLAIIPGTTKPEAPGTTGPKAK